MNMNGRFQSQFGRPVGRYAIFGAVRIGGLVQVVHSKSGPVSSLFLEVLLRRQFLAVPRFTLLYPVTVPGVTVEMEAFRRTPLPQQVWVERLVKAELQQLQVLLLQFAEICVIVLYGFLPV